MVDPWHNTAATGKAGLIHKGQFVGLLDILVDTKTAESAINAVFDTRQDLAMQLQFPGE